MNLQEISYILSTISLIFYSIVYVPQFYVIYKSKSSDGISFWMLLLWSQADVLSLIGTIVLHMPTSIVMIGWYHYTVGIIMILFVLYYTEKYTDNINTDEDEKVNINSNEQVNIDLDLDDDINNNINNNINHDINVDKNVDINYIYKFLATVVFISINTFTSMILNILISKSYDEIGAALGWVTMSFYLIGRVPQIWLNYKRKSTEGLSLLMYIFTMCGNGVYLAVITIDPLYIESNIPWIITCIVTVLMDIFVIGQHFYYDKHKVSII